MLKTYLTDNHISVYALSKKSGIYYSTLNDIVNEKVDIFNVKSGILYSMGRALQLSMDQLYDICTDNNIELYDENNRIYAYVIKKNKTYYLKYTYKNIEYQHELCAIKKESTIFIKSIALWQLEKDLSEIKMEEAYALCVKTQR